MPENRTGQKIIIARIAYQRRNRKLIRALRTFLESQYAELLGAATAIEQFGQKPDAPLLVHPNDQEKQDRSDRI